MLCNLPNRINIDQVIKLINELDLDKGLDITIKLWKDNLGV